MPWYIIPTHEPCIDTKRVILYTTDGQTAGHIYIDYISFEIGISIISMDSEWRIMDGNTGVGSSFEIFHIFVVVTWK